MREWERVRARSNLEVKGKLACGWVNGCICVYVYMYMFVRNMIHVKDIGQQKEVTENVKENTDSHAKKRRELEFKFNI